MTDPFICALESSHHPLEERQLFHIFEGPSFGVLAVCTNRTILGSRRVN